MQAKDYEYHRPQDLTEACRLLAELPEAHVLAGGTDLLFDIDADVRQAQHVIASQAGGNGFDLDLSGGLEAGGVDAAQQGLVEPKPVETGRRQGF